jgi:creatinine amidohydrolase
MSLPVRRWQDLTWTDFAGLDREATVAVLPVAAIEQHGPHLPLDVDARVDSGLLEAALDRLPEHVPVLVLPMQPVGTSAEHAAFPGTLSLSASTLAAVWTELARSVHAAGVRKLVIFNSHGGQAALARVVAQDLRSRLSMLVVVASTYAFGEPEGLFPEEEWRHGIHAGAAETSLMRHLAPASVREDRIAAFRPASIDLETQARELRFHGRVSLAWSTQDLHPSGACGDATLATAEAGRRMIEVAAPRIARLLAEFSAYPVGALRAGPSASDEG